MVNGRPQGPVNSAQLPGRAGDVMRTAVPALKILARRADPRSLPREPTWAPARAGPGSTLIPPVLKTPRPGPKTPPPRRAQYPPPRLNPPMPQPPGRSPLSSPLLPPPPFPLTTPPLLSPSGAPGLSIRCPSDELTTAPPSLPEAAHFVGGGWDDSNMCLAEQSARDAALAELARLDPAALDAAALMGQITDLATFISQAQGQLSRLTATLDATSGAAEAGHKSASAFLRTRCGLAPGRAAAVVATARGPGRAGSHREGGGRREVSFDQAQVIVATTAVWVRTPRAWRSGCYWITRRGWTPPGSASSPRRWPTGPIRTRRTNASSAAGTSATCRSA